MAAELCHPIQVPDQGLIPVDLVEIKATRGRITIVTRTEPMPTDEYTPSQRIAINAQLEKASEGPFHGPFGSGAEIRAYLKKFKREQSNRSKRPR